VNVTTPEWVDLPASYHNGACGYCFADGHSEIKKWIVGNTKVPIKYLDFGRISVTSDQRDYLWVKDRTSEPGN
jgi:prepilin-type processing-associated H-X9-DG protein